MNVEQLLDLVFDILDGSIDFDTGIRNLENNYSNTMLLSAEEGGKDVIFFIFSALVNKKLSRDFKEPLDFSLLKWFLDKGASVNKLYDYQIVHFFCTGPQTNDSIRNLKKASSILTMAKHVAKEQKSVEEYMHEQIGAAYIGFQEFYDVLEYLPFYHSEKVLE
jgi:hypothetical protein